MTEYWWELAHKRTHAEELAHFLALAHRPPVRGVLLIRAATLWRAEFDA